MSSREEKQFISRVFFLSFSLEFPEEERKPRRKGVKRQEKCVKLTGDKDLNLFAENGADSIACDALVDASVFPSYGLDFVDGLR